jgi:hypothetical protein
MSQRFFVVHEARADFTTATELADRVLTSEIDWLDETLLDSQRQWIGEDQPGEPLTWTSIPSRAQELGIKVHGHFGGDPGLPDAKAARRAIAYVLRRHEAVDAILLIRDRDDQAERQQGLEQARESYSHLASIVIGLAISERECRVLSGFEPKDEIEREKLTEEIQHLGFDPCRGSHHLTACKNDQAKRSPKRVLAKLIGRDRDRERECWLLTSLEMLRDRGDGNGLAGYLQEVEDYLVPLITGRRRDSG